MELILLMMQKISASVPAIRFRKKFIFTILEPFGWYNTILLISEKGTPFLSKLFKTSPSSVIPRLSNKKTNKNHR